MNVLNYLLLKNGKVLTFSKDLPKVKSDKINKILLECKHPLLPKCWVEVGKSSISGFKHITKINKIKAMVEYSYLGDLYDDPEDDYPKETEQLKTISTKNIPIRSLNELMGLYVYDILMKRALSNHVSVTCAGDIAWTSEPIMLRVGDRSKRYKVDLWKLVKKLLPSKIIDQTKSYNEDPKLLVMRDNKWDSVKMNRVAPDDFPIYPIDVYGSIKIYTSISPSVLRSKSITVERTTYDVEMAISSMNDLIDKLNSDGDDIRKLKDKEVKKFKRSITDSIQYDVTSIIPIQTIEPITVMELLSDDIYKEMMKMMYLVGDSLMVVTKYSVEFKKKKVKTLQIEEIIGISDPNHPEHIYNYTKDKDGRLIIELKLKPKFEVIGTSNGDYLRLIGPDGKAILDPKEHEEALSRLTIGESLSLMNRESLSSKYRVDISTF